MKNRKRVIVAFMLVAVMLLGVGYAALSDDLFITGSATILEDNAEDAFAADVYFSKAIISADKGTAVISDDDNGGVKDKITITVDDSALSGQGSSVLCAIEITNSGDLDAWVTLDSIVVSNNNYFNVTTSWGNTTTQKIAKGATIDLNVTIICTATPQQTVSTTFDLGFTATDTDPANP